MKKLKTLFAILIGTMIVFTIFSNNNKSNATDDTLYLKLEKMSPEVDPSTGRKAGYTIGDPTVAVGSAKYIWNIVSYTDNTFATYNDWTKTNLYCLKAEAGFSNAQKQATYTRVCSINDKERMLRDACTHTYVNELVNSDYYNKVRWIINNMYIKGQDTQQDKEQLLYDAGIRHVNGEGEDLPFGQVLTGYEEWYYTAGVCPNITEGNLRSGGLGYNRLLSDDELVAIQQAAIWYFTNGSSSSYYNNLNKINWECTTTDGNTYSHLSVSAEEQSRIIYKYLIDSANAYSASIADKGAFEIVKDNAKIKISGDNYIVGPITIKNNQDNNNITTKVTNESDINIDNFKYVNSNGTEISGFNINTYEGDFYISLEKNKAKKVKIRFDYKNRDAFLYIEEGTTGDQPVVKPEFVQDKVLLELEIEKQNKYSIVLVKQDKSGVQLNSKATFEVNGVSQEVTGKLEIAKDVLITATNLATPDVYTIKEITAPDEYCKFNGLITVTVTKKEVNDTYEVDKVEYKVTDEEGNDITGLTGADVNVYLNEDKNIYVEVKNYKNSYDLVLVKQDKNGVQLNSKATFEVNGVSKDVTGRLEIAKNVQITDANVATPDIYIIKETKAPDEYCEFNGIITVTVTKKEVNNRYEVDKVEYKVTDKDGNDITDKKGNDVKVYLNENGNIYVEVKNYQFDLKLVKRITEVNGDKVPERLNKEDASKLNTYDENGNKITTADYKMTKDPVLVKNGDIITYTFRVYNEADISGYASEITEDIPEGLQFIWSDKVGDELKNDTTLTEQEKKAVEFNQSRLWKYTDKDLKTISTTYLSKENGETNLIKAFDSTTKELDYKEVSVMLKVTAKNSFDGIIRNEAEISEDTDSEGNPINDRDSDTEKWGKENDDKYYDDNKKWPTYKEDDECYDNIKLQYFDLALRKFITSVEDEVVTNRIPEVTYKDEKLEYKHTKDALVVHVGDVVTYTIRVFNEGKVDGYAEEVTDDIPDYLEYLPEHKTNKEYRWVMKDKEGKEVTKVSKAEKVTTDYLSSAQQTETKRDNLLKAFIETEEISEKNPDYRDIKIAFKVKDPKSNKYIITNHAQISEDSDDDIDSKPNEWNEGEDDQDIENVKVEYFDLALRKYVTEAIVIENGKQTVTKTGHKAEDDPEKIVKVDLGRRSLSSVEVKFRYKIKITNEGDIEGYATEITDYIPKGLKFEAKDNPKWKDEGNNVISTEQLKDKLLQPGESTEIEVLLTWIKDANNMGVKVNTAEISKDKNKYDLPDRDSTPDNKKPGEDDIDDAPIMITIKTGQTRIYYLLGTTILAIIGTGIFLIKKYVL